MLYCNVLLCQRLGSVSQHHTGWLVKLINLFMCVKEREKGMSPFPFLQTIITNNSLLFLCYSEHHINKKNHQAVCEV